MSKKDKHDDMVYTCYETEKEPSVKEDPAVSAPAAGAADYVRVSGKDLLETLPADKPKETVEIPEVPVEVVSMPCSVPNTIEAAKEPEKAEPESGPVRAKVLDTAKQIILHDRQQTHGDPEDNFAVIANLWSAYLNRAISPSDVAMLMILVKIARSKTGSSLDNFIDIAGYAACAGEIYEKTKEW